MCSKLPDTADIVREAIFRQVIDRLEPGQGQTPDAKTLGYQHLPKALPFDSSPVSKWLSVKITAADDRLEYHESEPIVLIARFSSRARYMYKVEAAEGLSKAAVDLLHTSNGQRIPLNRTGIVCCDSRLIGLDDEPYIPPTRTPLKLTAGEYEIYLTSRRVFKWDAAAQEYNPSSFEVASNLLKIRVLPDSVVDRRFTPTIRPRQGAEAVVSVIAMFQLSGEPPDLQVLHGSKGLNYPSCAMKPLRW